VLDGEESPADVVADCLCRTWEDQPAVTHLAPEPERTTGVDAIRRRLDRMERPASAAGRGLA
jgi:hypothetical protein